MASKALESHSFRFRAMDEEPDDERMETGVRRRESALIGVWRLRCLRRPSSIAGSIATLLPALVTVNPDGTAIAHYPGDGTMHFCDLAHLMAHHDLTIVDFEEELSES